MTGVDACDVQVNVWTVTAAAAVTCLATGLGAMPFLFVRKGMTRNWLGVSNAVASGFMLALVESGQLFPTNPLEKQTQKTAVIGWRNAGSCEL